MPKLNLPLLTYNRGIIDDEALARVDVERTRLSASVMTNWLPKPLGPMMLRPGTQYLGSSRGDTGAEWIEFNAGEGETALIEMTPGIMRVWQSGELITRESVATTVVNGTFADTGDLTDTGSDGWEDVSSGGGEILIDTSLGFPALILLPEPVGSVAKIRQLVAVDTGVGDNGTEHGLHINVYFGPVRFRVGSTAGGEDYFSETILQTGVHSLSFTPAGAFYIEFSAEAAPGKAGTIHAVRSVAVESGGAMSVEHDFDIETLERIRYDQSADVVFVAGEGVRQKRIERRGDGRSWSVVNYIPLKGPFIPGRTRPVRLRTANRAGATTLTADEAFFDSGHVGAIFRMYHPGQNRDYVLQRNDIYSEPWEVTGVDTGSERESTIDFSGPFSGTLLVQKSFDGPEAGFRTVASLTDTGITKYQDDHDNLSVWYRVGIDTGGYVSGTANVKVRYAGGQTRGIGYVYKYSSATQVSFGVLDPLASTDWTIDWNEGSWSDVRGYPTAPALDAGRLWWAGGAQVWGSVSDEYDNFDDATEGDAAPLARTLGKGPVNRINFMQSASRLLLGTSGSIIQLRSTEFDEPLTQTNAQAKQADSRGTADLRAVAIDTKVVFVHTSEDRVYMLVDDGSGGYQSLDLTKLVPTLLGESVRSIAIQRYPDTRIHCVLSDGTVAILTYDAEEDVLCWWKWETDGAVLKAMVLPFDYSTEDSVYYHIQRTINGETKRYLEVLRTEADCQGGSLHWQADCATFLFSGTALNAAPHLRGKRVVVWGDGKSQSPVLFDLTDTGTYHDTGTGLSYNQRLFEVDTGATGTFVADTGINLGVVGLPYSATHVSTKLAYGAALGTALTQQKRVNQIGLILKNTHNNGLFFGRDSGHLDPLPRTIDGQTVNDSGIHRLLEIDNIPFPGDFDTDSRIWLKAFAPHPVTVMASVPQIKTNDAG